MVKHVVMWNLKPEKNNGENLKKLKQVIENLQGKIPGLLSANVNFGFNGYQAVLISEHTDKKALEDYAVHPEHVAILEFVRDIVSERAACDFEC